MTEMTEETNAPQEDTRAGFVALVGAPNAGKSTLMNTMIGSKISIVSPKVQTTRSRIVGIGTEGVTQLIYVDTPGIFRPRRRLDRAMVAAAWQGADDADAVVQLVDASRHSVDVDTKDIIAQLTAADRKVILALNKIDLIPRERLLTLTEEMNASGAFSDIFMISALTGDGVADLRAHLASLMPKSPWLYPEDQLSDMPMRLLASELTREQIFLQLHEELPYSIAVETESWEEFEDGSVKVSQIIYVDRENQKPIVLGKGGQRIRSIGAAARKELETMLDRRAHLMLFVKVRENWAERAEHYKPWGLDYNA